MGCIKIVSGHDTAGYESKFEWRDLLEANLKEYATRWGHELVMKFDDWGPTTRQIWWRKLELVRQEFVNCDWLLWVDTDCFFLNMTTPLTRYTGDSFRVRVSSVDMYVTGPFASTCRVEICPVHQNPAYSAGVFLLRNCRWSHELLEEWWESDNKLWRLPGCNWLGDSSYMSCVLMNDPERRKHISVFPLTEIGWANMTGKPEQFIMHCYGSTGPQRRERFEQYERCVIR
jgi:hypothetical protein